MKFSDITGQQEVKTRLVNSVRNNRISHAQLFFEMPGAGALPLAVAYAQYMNCENQGGADSCGKCSQCLKMEKLVHPDLHFSIPVAADSKQEKKALSDAYATEWRKAFLENPYLNLADWFAELGFETNKNLIHSVEEAGNIIHKLSFKNFEAAYKVCIIWCPEKFHVQAINAMLKIIEEPPDKTVFLLVTENYDQQLPTILSRMQLVKIPRISNVDIVAALERNFDKSGEEAKRIVHLCNGSYRAAIELAGEESNEKFDELFIGWMRLCLQPMKNYEKLNTWIENIAKRKREQLKIFFAFGLETCRECLLINYAAPAMVRFDDMQFPNLSRFAPYINQNNADQFSKLLSDAHYQVERNANPKILFLDLSFKLAELLAIK